MNLFFRAAVCVFIRRYCGEGGISSRTLDALAMRAAADGKDNGDNINRNNSNGGIPSSLPSASVSEEYQLASMLDKAHDEIVDMLMTQHLAGYQVVNHAQD